MTPRFHYHTNSPVVEVDRSIAHLMPLAPATQHTRITRHSRAACSVVVVVSPHPRSASRYCTVFIAFCLRWIYHGGTQDLRALRAARAALLGGGGRLGGAFCPTWCYQTVTSPVTKCPTNRAKMHGLRGGTTGIFYLWHFATCRLQSTHSLSAMHFLRGFWGRG